MSKALPLGCLLVLATLHAAQQQPTAPSSGLILGRVVDGQSDRPIAGVTVTLILTTPAGMVAMPVVARSVITDQQGRFVFRLLPKGTYALLGTVGGNGFSTSGFIGSQQQIGPYIDGAYGQRRAGGARRTIVLGDGEHIPDAVIRLWHGAALNGTVTDEAGEPLVGVAVAAVRIGGNGHLLDGPTTRTDDRGMYRLGTLAPGTYVVLAPQTQVVMPASIASDGISIGASTLLTASPQDLRDNRVPPRLSTGASFMYPTLFAPSSTTIAGALAVPLSAGEERNGVDIQLRPVRAVAVSGVLTEGAGPVPGFEVHLMPPESENGTSVLETATTSTDAEGAFTFPLVPAGQYRVVAVRTQPNRPAPLGAVAPRLPSGTVASQAISVGGQNISNLALTLRPGVHVSGRVEFQGRAPKPAQRPNIVLVLAQPMFRSERMRAQPTATVDADGAFTIPDVIPGRYLIRVASNIRPPWGIDSVVAEGRDASDGFSVDRQDLGDILIRYTDQPAGLVGTVSSSDTRALDNASVLIFPTERAGWNEASLNAPRVVESMSPALPGFARFRAVRPSTSGAFVAPNLVPGEYFVIATDEANVADWTDVKFLEKLATVARTVRIMPGQQSTISLPFTEVR